MTHPNTTTRAPRTSSRSTSLSWAAASSLVSRIQFQGDHSWCLSQRDRTRSKMSSHALRMLWRLQIFSTRYRRSCSCRRGREILGTCKENYRIADLALMQIFRETLLVKFKVEQNRYISLHVFVYSTGI